MIFEICQERMSPVQWNPSDKESTRPARAWSRTARVRKTIRVSGQRKQCFSTAAIDVTFHKKECCSKNGENTYSDYIPKYWWSLSIRILLERYVQYLNLKAYVKLRIVSNHYAKINCSHSKWKSNHTPKTHNASVSSGAHSLSINLHNVDHSCSHMHIHIRSTQARPHSKMQRPTYSSDQQGEFLLKSWSLSSEDAHLQIWLWRIIETQQQHWNPQCSQIRWIIIEFNLAPGWSEGCKCQQYT